MTTLHIESVPGTIVHNVPRRVYLIQLAKDLQKLHAHTMECKHLELRNRDVQIVNHFYTKGPFIYYVSMFFPFF